MFDNIEIRNISCRISSILNAERIMMKTLQMKSIGAALALTALALSFAACPISSPSFTLTYTAGTNGRISGQSPQTVLKGGNGTTVTAVPDSGYHFSSWSDSSTTNPRTDTAVNSDLGVTAIFAADAQSQYVLSYSAGANGTISGPARQTVGSGASGAAVTAVPDPGYHFVAWSDRSRANPRLDANVARNISVAAVFAADAASYTLIYSAGVGGTISGSASQTVASGGGGTAVRAVPDPGYFFSRWSDGSADNPRADTIVLDNISVSAEFTLYRYSLSYVAGAHGTINGAASQSVPYGGSGSAVAAEPDPDYYFVAWSDGSTDNPRTDQDVTGDICVTAFFESSLVPSFVLSYSAGANGTISGTAVQIVRFAESGSAVMAVPDPDYHFVDWSDGRRDNPRTDSDVYGDISVSANFAFNTTQYTLTYSAGPNGTISGTSHQVVYAGESGIEVTAVPDPNYSFAAWSDGVPTRSRVDSNVAGDLSVTANFVPNVVLSGTLAVTVNGAAANVANWQVFAFSYEADSDGSPIGYGDVNAAGAWSISFPRRSAPTTIYFNALTPNNREYLLSQTVTAYQTNVSGIALSQTCATLAGTCSGFMGPVSIFAVKNPATNQSVNDTVMGGGFFDTGSWSFEADVTKLGGNVYFLVYDGVEDAYYVTNNPMTIGTSGASGILLARSGMSYWLPSGSITSLKASGGLKRLSAPHATTARPPLR
jgi:hypothetical protein